MGFSIMWISERIWPHYTVSPTLPQPIHYGWCSFSEKLSANIINLVNSSATTATWALTRHEIDGGFKGFDFQKLCQIFNYILCFSCLRMFLILATCYVCCDSWNLKTAKYGIFQISWITTKTKSCLLTVLWKSSFLSSLMRLQSFAKYCTVVIK